MADNKESIQRMMGSNAFVKRIVEDGQPSLHRVSDTKCKTVRPLKETQLLPPMWRFLNKRSIRQSIFIRPSTTNIHCLEMLRNDATWPIVNLQESDKRLIIIMYCFSVAGITKILRILAMLYRKIIPPDWICEIVRGPTCDNAMATIQENKLLSASE